MKIIISKKRKVKLLTHEQQESYENSKMCYDCKESLKINMLKIKNIIKFEIIIIIQVNIEVLLTVYVI